jgi:hypothetical protein
MAARHTPSPPDVELVRLLHRRNELDRAIQLLEEIRLIRLKRPPELTVFVSKVQRRVA